MSDPGDYLRSTIRIEGGDTRLCRVHLPAAHVRVTDGPDAGGWEAYASPSIRIGTGPECDLVLSDPTVSRHHATLELREDGAYLVDAGSSNGTFVGDLKVHEAPVGEGLDCRVGKTSLRIELRADERTSVVGEDTDCGGMLGRSPAMQEIFGLVRAVAPSLASVLVTGESGTGKELVARALHERSGREGPFVVFDAATADPAMVRSDLFGHVAGAFTDARTPRKGAFREAHGGTLFLDEIGELPLDLQPRLLRVLESRTVQPVGQDTAEPVDVRVVSATHRDLQAMVEAGTFRSDLFHRLRVVEVHLPPLRERAGDVGLLLEHFQRELGVTLRLSEAARARLEDHSWPGNIRDLRNAVERLGLVCRDRVVEVADLGLVEPRGDAPVDGPTPPPVSRMQGRRVSGAPLLEMERRTIEEALARNDGNKAATARELGMSISTLKRRLKDYGHS